MRLAKTCILHEPKYLTSRRRLARALWRARHHQQCDMRALSLRAAHASTRAIMDKLASACHRRRESSKYHAPGTQSDLMNTAVIAQLHSLHAQSPLMSAPANVLILRLGRGRRGDNGGTRRIGTMPNVAQYKPARATISHASAVRYRPTPDDKPQMTCMAYSRPLCISAAMQLSPSS